MISVLLVDDEPALLDITQIFLEKDGKMTVTLSESAEDALALLRGVAFDIIISDYEMPTMNGIEFLKAVKARGLEIPFIIFTGRGREHVAIEALNLGASFYLQKGGDPKSQFAELRNMVMQAVQRKKAEDEVRLNQRRLQAMIDLHQMSGADVHDLSMYAMEKAIDLTGSTIGYIAFLNEEETVLSMYAWSQSALQSCRISEKPMVYPVEKTGLWGDPVRQRRPVITNDYQAAHTSRKGYPEGHVPISRHMGVPVTDGARIVMLAGLGNKVTEYSEDDIRQVTHLMGGLWQILKRKRIETELHESERRFRSYFELPLTGIAIISPDMRWLTVNEKLCRMLGYSRDELMAIRWTDLTPPDDLGNEITEYEKVIAGEKESHTLEKKFIRKDGSAIDVEVSAIPVRKEHGEVDYFVALIQDISPLKQAKEELQASNDQMAATLEELRATQDSMNEYCHRLEREELALRESEEKFRIMVETAPSMLIITDQKGTITYASPNTLKFTGFTPEEIPEQGLSLVYPDDRSRVREFASRAYHEQKNSGNIEFRSVKKDGEVWYASGSVEPLRNQQGTCSGFLIQIIDITSQKDAEEELRQNREKYRELVENVSDVVFSLDNRGIVTYASPAVTRVLGYQPDAVTSHHFSDFLLPGDVPSANEGYASLEERANQGPLTVDWQVKTGTGDERWVRITLRLQKDGEIFTGCTGTLTDIQEQRKALEDLKERKMVLQDIFHAAPVGIGMVQDCVITWINDPVSRMTGYVPEEIVGKNTHIFYSSAEESDRISQVMYSRLWEDGEGSIETRWVKKDGSMIDVLITNSPLNPGDPASPIIFTVSDITERKRSETALIESELLLRTFIDAFSEPAFLMTADGEVITANGAFCNHYHASGTGEEGMNVYALFHRNSGGVLKGYVEEVLHTGREARFEMAENGRVCLFNLYPVSDSSGNLTRVAVFPVDITDQKKDRDVVSLLNKKLSILSCITRHDAFNRVEDIGNYLDLMKEQTADPLLLTYLHKEERGVRALRDLLDFSEEYQNTGMETPSWQDVSSAIRKSAGLLDLNQVTIYLDCEGLDLHADSMLEKVFFSLIENALLYGGTPSGITFSYRECEDGLILLCEDDGRGVLADQKESIFSPGIDRHKGCGLFLVREILAMWGFSISETGIPGEGARFEIRVPDGSYRFSQE